MKAFTFSLASLLALNLIACDRGDERQTAGRDNAGRLKQATPASGAEKADVAKTNVPKADTSLPEQTCSLTPASDGSARFVLVIDWKSADQRRQVQAVSFQNEIALPRSPQQLGSSDSAVTVAEDSLMTWSTGAGKSCVLTNAGGRIGARVEAEDGSGGKVAYRALELNGTLRCPDFELSYACTGGVLGE